ncbi:hypothetical protein GCM10027058_23820 [Microbacterium neimengense]
MDPAPSTTRRDALPWVGFGLAVAPLALILLTLTTGVSTGGLSAVFVPAIVAGLVLSIVALAKKKRPRWPAITAIVLIGIGFVAWGAFAIWAIAGFVQIMML